MPFGYPRYGDENDSSGAESDTLYWNVLSSSRVYKKNKELVQQIDTSREKVTSRNIAEDPVPGIYRTLSIHEQEIRLCVLEPSTDDEAEIHCHLEHVILGSSRPYEALSYVWGIPKLTEQICLDGQPFHVTPNLLSALRHLRYPDRERVLWIDALCIHQSNLGERTSQVRHMREIYSHCTRDVLWMGPEDSLNGPSCVSGMRVMENLSCGKLDDILSIGWKRIEAKSLDPKPIVGRAIVYPSQSDWCSLKSLLKTHLIWTRVWIIQEVSLSSQMVLMCGRHTLDWKHIEDFLDTGDDYGDAFRSPFGHDADTLTTVFEKVQILKTQRAALRRPGEKRAKSSLLEVLARFRFTLATDDRDKVYGLLGLISQPGQVRADYTKSLVEVYVETATELIRQSKNLDIICQSPWRSFGNKDRHPGIPTWCPDFAVPGQPIFLFAQRSIYSAGAPECSLQHPPSETGVLSLSGLYVDTLATVPEESVIDTNYGDAVSRYYRREQVCRDLYNGWASAAHQSSEQYFTGEDIPRAFYRTLVGDCTAYPTNRLDPEQLDEQRELFQAFCDHDPNAIDDESVQPEHSDDGTPIEKKPKSRPRLPDNSMLSKMMANWQFAITSKKLFALVPKGSQVGDVVVVLDGAKVPLTLRPKSLSDGEQNADFKVVYEVIGGTYLHGYMDGEAYSASAFEKRVFHIQ